MPNIRTRYADRIKKVVYQPTNEKVIQIQIRERMGKTVRHTKSFTLHGYYFEEVYLACLKTFKREV